MKKFLSLLLCLLLFLQCAPLSLAENTPDGGDPPTVIRTAKDFVRFAENCASDTYSRGKAFELAADLDLSDSDFEPIPWFGGSFDGKNHRITGLRFAKDGSRQGLFRIVAEGASVSNLRVSGTVTPGGSGCYAGGIAGVNSGTLSGCRFEGTVSGLECIGGIAGHNSVTGTITGCSFRGDVTAEHQAAGIAGLNDGTILDSENLGSVNTVAITPHEQPVDSLLNAHFDISQISESDFLNLSNIGGIAGDNTGIISRCSNEAPVGYRSTGYNVGGIAGTSSGYVSECKNSAEINGRRDVGGIVGQLIPFSDWDLSSGKFDALSWQISILNGELNNLSYNFESYGSSIYDSAARLRSYTEDMTNALWNMAAYAANNDQQIINSIRDSIYVDPSTGEISFSQPDLGNIDSSALSASLSNMYGESLNFVNLAQNATGSLAADIRRVSDQITSVFNVLFSTVSDLASVAPETTDLSEAEAYTRNTGAISACNNYGTVIGENNCGGVLGTAGFEVEFDMEDRLNISDYLTSNSRHSLFAAVRDCGCVGETEARGGTAGGIVGNMDLGIIIGCTTIGSVSAGSGDYVGGLVGHSTGSVWYSWSRSLLHGGKYVGGVAGYGTTICDCRSWVHFEQQSEYAGAVAGWVESGRVEGNFFVEGKPGGVDGISLTGQSDALSEQEFLALEGVPAEFESITIQYRADGKILSSETIPFGGRLRNIPEVENRDGRYWVWDLPEEERIFSSLTIDGSYHAPKSTISIPGDPPVFLVEGQFYDGQELHVLDAVPPELPGEVLASYTLAVNDFADALTVRMLTSTDGALYITAPQGGAPVRTDWQRDGSYIVFRMPNGASLCYTSENTELATSVLSDTRLLLICLVPAVALLVLILILIHLNIKRRRRRRAAARAAAAAGKAEAVRVETAPQPPVAPAETEPGREEQKE